MASQKRYGIQKERQVAGFLHRRGAGVALSPGSQGPADLIADWANAVRWHVQVKASRTGRPASLSSRDLGRLRKGATLDGAIPVVAEVVGNRVIFWDARGS
jgi:Holliday junction resolvase